MIRFDDVWIKKSIIASFTINSAKQDFGWTTEALAGMKIVERLPFIGHEGIAADIYYVQLRTLSSTGDLKTFYSTDLLFPDFLGDLLRLDHFMLELLNRPECISFKEALLDKVSLHLSQINDDEMRTLESRYERSVERSREKA